MDAAVEALVATGHAALVAGEWTKARAAFEGALNVEDNPEAAFGLGDALWWLGDAEGAIRCRERAYGAFRRRADPAHAAIAAMRLCLTYRANMGNHAASRGWAARAARLVEDFGVEPLRGWAMLTRALVADDPSVGEALARGAHTIARSTGDADLELCALSEIGAWLVELGRVDEGVALLDEAMAGSLGGEATSLNTVVYTSCHTLITYSRVVELERAAQWIRALEGFSGRYGCPFLHTMCRTLYGSILFVTGRWAEAEAELEAARRMSRSAERALYGEALARLAELRLAQGSVEAAERLVAGFEDHVAVASVVGAIHLVRGEADAAGSIAVRWLGEVGEGRLESAPLMELHAESQLRSGNGERAVAIAHRLVALGRALGCEAVVARGERTLGAALVAVGDVATARVHLDAAIASFARLQMALEAGRAHLLLAAALVEEGRDAAVADAQSALAIFDALGAARDADSAASLLRTLGVNASRSGGRGIGLLTKRELEVLALLGEGLPNRDIAQRLYLTTKTVEHHVARLRSKLGLRTRAEAAAYAARHLEGDRARN